MKNIKTADIYDAHPNEVCVATPMFRNYGGVQAFAGQIATVKVHEDNVLVRQSIEEAGNGRVLIIDGGGSLRCALVGDILAQLALDNGWVGIIVYGCIRDASDIANIPLGVQALNTNPTKSVKKGEGERDSAVTFAGITFTPGHFVYADNDGIIISERNLL